MSPKEIPVTNINKHLRSISLTPTTSKVGEQFVVRPAILKTIDPNRFGGISPNFSTIHALISMTQWEQATGGTSAAVRTVLLDYTKAFDSIDHRILFQQILRLDILYEIQYWARDFLTDKYERIKISNDCYF